MLDFFLQKLKKDSEFHKEEAVKSFRQKCFFLIKQRADFSFWPISFSLLTI